MGGQPETVSVQLGKKKQCGRLWRGGAARLQGLKEGWKPWGS